MGQHSRRDRAGKIARAVRELRAVLAAFGTELLAGVAVHVPDSTAKLRYPMLPMRPAGTEKMSEEGPASLATRDTMTRISVPRVPSSP